MKKLFYFLFFLGTCFFSAACGYLSLILILGILNSFGYVLVVLLLFFAVELLDRMQRLFSKKQGVSCKRIILTTQLPSVIVSVLFFLLILWLDQNGYWDNSGWFAGLEEFLFSLSWIVYSAALFVGILLRSGIRCLFQKNRAKN